MQTYLELLRDVYESGSAKSDRTGTGTRSVFGRQLRFNLSQGFPLITTKKVHWKSVAHELIWFLRGDTNVSYLQENGVRIWNEWADDEGSLGRVYGAQWRDWKGPDGKSIDQIHNVVNQIKENPDSRRHLVVAYNPGEVDQMALPPCHAFFQFYVAGGKLSCQLYQRSADIFLGVPFNIASYALLTHMVAQATGYKVGEFVHSFGDLHLYNNHLEQAEMQLSRTPLELPRISLNPEIKDLFKFTYDDITLHDYKSHSSIKAPVAV